MNNDFLIETYGRFNNIAKDLDKKSVTLDFWKKEKNNIEKIVKEGRLEKSSMEMSNEKLHKRFYT